jgi:hypothetical protein
MFNLISHFILFQLIPLECEYQQDKTNKMCKSTKQQIANGDAITPCSKNLDQTSKADLSPDRKVCHEDSSLDNNLRETYKPKDELNGTLHDVDIMNVNRKFHTIAEPKEVGKFDDVEFQYNDQ